ALLLIRARAKQLREILRDRLVDALDQAAIDGDPNQCGHHGLRGRLDVARAGCTRTAVVVFKDELAAMAHQQAVESRQGLAGSYRRSQRRGSVNAEGGTNGEQRRRKSSAHTPSRWAHRELFYRRSRGLSRKSRPAGGQS